MLLCTISSELYTEVCCGDIASSESIMHFLIGAYCVLAVIMSGYAATINIHHPEQLPEAVQNSLVHPIVKRSTDLTHQGECSHGCDYTETGIRALEPVDTAEGSASPEDRLLAMIHQHDAENKETTLEKGDNSKFGESEDLKALCEGINEDCQSADTFIASLLDVADLQHKVDLENQKFGDSKSIPAYLGVENVKHVNHLYFDDLDGEDSSRPLALEEFFKDHHASNDKPNGHVFVISKTKLSPNSAKKNTLSKGKVTKTSQQASKFHTVTVDDTPTTSLVTPVVDKSEITNAANSELVNSDLDGGDSSMVTLENLFKDYPSLDHKQNGNSINKSAKDLSLKSSKKHIQSKETVTKKGKQTLKSHTVVGDDAIKTPAATTTTVGESESTHAVDSILVDNGFDSGEALTLILKKFLKDHPLLTFKKKENAGHVSSNSSKQKSESKTKKHKTATLHTVGVIKDPTETSRVTTPIVSESESAHTTHSALVNSDLKSEEFLTLLLTDFLKGHPLSSFENQDNASHVSPNSSKTKPKSKTGQQRTEKVHTNGVVQDATETPAVTSVSNSNKSKHTNSIHVDHDLDKGDSSKLILEEILKKYPQLSIKKKGNAFFITTKKSSSKVSKGETQDKHKFTQKAEKTTKTHAIVIDDNTETPPIATLVTESEKTNTPAETDVIDSLLENNLPNGEGSSTVTLEEFLKSSIKDETNNKNDNLGGGESTLTFEEFLKNHPQLKNKRRGNSLLASIKKTSSNSTKEQNHPKGNLTTKKQQTTKIHTTVDHTKASSSTPVVEEDEGTDVTAKKTVTTTVDDSATRHKPLTHDMLTSITQALLEMEQKKDNNLNVEDSTVEQNSTESNKDDECVNSLSEKYPFFKTLFEQRKTVQHVPAVFLPLVPHALLTVPTHSALEEPRKCELYGTLLHRILDALKTLDVPLNKLPNNENKEVTTKQKTLSHVVTKTKLL